MSEGIRSGVNWMRRAERPKTVPSVSTSLVLARPGTPIEQAVAAGEDGDQRALDDRLLAVDDAADRGAGGPDLGDRAFRFRDDPIGVGEG